LLEEERQVSQNYLNKLPGEKIRDLMESWAMEDITTNDDIQNIQDEMWMTAEDFERRLDQDIKGY
jgi:hypothetical protein